MQLLRNKIARFVRQHLLFEPGDTVVVALSGGADSVALLDILANLPGCGPKLVPAHLNHCLRGDESDGDEQFVRQLVARYGLTAEIRRVDVSGVAAHGALSLEEAGRDARYGFFRELALRSGASAVALAHHRDDQAETVLLRLLRGSAGSGLCAMRAKGEEELFVRPLLAISRGEIEAYLRRVGLTWREDSSNSDTRFLRNRIRHELLPQLRSYNPRIAESLGQTAEALARDEELLRDLTAAAFGRCVAADPQGHTLALDLLAREHPALRPRIYRMAIAAVKGDLRRISFDHLAAVESLATSPRPSGSVDLPGDLTVQREYGRLHFCRRGCRGEMPPAGPLMIHGPGSYRLPDGSELVVEAATSLPDGWRDQGRFSLWVSAAAVPFPWEVRTFLPGDRFQPLGMEGEKKLKNLFIDRKIPLPERRRIPIFLAKGKIFWVGGLQPASLAGGVQEGEAVIRLQLCVNIR